MAATKPANTSAGTVDRDDNVYKAKLCEQIERYYEMVDCMKKIAQLHSELTVEERNLLSIAYKNVINARRESWQIALELEQKELAKGDDANKIDLSSIQLYKEQIQKELKQICNDVLSLLDQHLLPTSSSEENKVFFYKMKGDYYRYLADVAVDDERREIAENSLVAYKAATEIGRLEMAPTHPVRLALALNFSVFYYEMLGSTERACRLAKAAFDDAIADLDSLSEESYKDATAIMQQLRDNLTLWTSDALESGKGDSTDAAEPSATELDFESEEAESEVTGTARSESLPNKEFHDEDDT